MPLRRVSTSMPALRLRRDGQVLRFGDFGLDCVAGHLCRGEQPVPLRDKSFAVLRYLVENAGRLVTRDQLLAAVWPGLSISAGVVRISIAEVRAALDDDAAAPRFIETVGRRGYRFTAGATAAPSARSEFVGREAELGHLHAHLERCRRQRRQIVFVSGEPGIGKTALVDRFATAVRDGGLARVGQGQCVDLHGSTEPYLPVLELLGQLSREHGDVDRVLERWAPSWLAQIPAAAPAAARRGGLPSPTRERMLRELADAMEVLARTSPLVLVLEDLHWSDASTLDLITYLAERSTPASLLIVGTYRPVEAVLRNGALRRTIRELIARGRAVERALELLTLRDVETYFERLFAGAAIDTDLAAAMHAKSEGNPLLLAEIVEHLLERGILALVAGRWRLGVGHASLPQSLRELVARDFEALDDEDRRVLAAASAVGNDFEAISVAAASGLAQGAVEERCAQLADRQQLIRTTGMTGWPDGTLGGTYRFRHAVHREAIYRRLAPTERVRLHRAVGDRLEAGWMEGLAPMAATLASHFEQGGDWPRAVHHHVAAIAAAKARLADPEVAVHGRAALRLLHRLPASAERDLVEMRCALDLAVALLAVSGYGTAEVEPLFTRARDLAIARDQPGVEVAARAGLFTAEVTGGTQPKALALATELLEMAERFPQPLVTVMGHACVGTSQYNLGNGVEARLHFARARAAWESDGARLQRDEKGLLLGLGALVLQHLGEDADGDAWIEALIGYVEPRADPMNAARACDLIARYRNGAGDRDQGYRWAERALQLAEGHGFPATQALARIEKGHALGDLELQRAGFAALGTIGCRVYVPVHRLQMAEVLIAEQRWGEARAEVEHAFAAMADTGEARHLAEAHRLRARCLSAEAHAGEAAAELRQAIAVARRQHARQFERRARADLSNAQTRPRSVRRIGGEQTLR